jgi:hypothetical protein
MAAELGQAEVLIPLAKCPQQGDPMPTGAFILNAMLVSMEKGWFVKTTHITEVFWETGA